MTKRTAAAISPIASDSGKTRKIMMDKTETEEKLKKLDTDIMEIVEKEDPTNKDLIRMMMLISRRDTLKIQFEVVPAIVSSMLDARLTEEFAEGGIARQALTEEITTATEGIIRRVQRLEEESASTEKHLSSMKTPRKIEKIIRNERIRCIEASDKGVVVFGVSVREGESGTVDDKRLEEVVRKVAGPEEVLGWKRLVGSRAALHDWKGKGMPKISIHVRTREARERIIKEARKVKQYDVKREIPELLIEEFKELQKEAAMLRAKESCHTYVGFAGADIFLRQRKDEKTPWKTVKRL